MRDDVADRTVDLRYISEIYVGEDVAQLYEPNTAMPWGKCHSIQ